MKDKRPIVYAARKITHFNKVEELCGYYVSKAYLNFVGKWYDKEGNISKEYVVDFVNNLEMLDFADEFYAETDHNVSRAEIFTSFNDCKKFVNEQNYLLYTNGDSYTRLARQVMYKKVINHGEKLEQRYISPEEINSVDSQQTSEEEFVK